MATIKQSIQDWQHIFLDSSIIINLLLYKKNPDEASAAFVYKLISYLSANKTKDNKNRIFYISAITISEILIKENDREKIEKILTAIDSQDVEFISFDEAIALQMTSQMHSYLANTELHRFAEEIGWKSHELMLAREWITRDYMIVMSGINRKVDVLLTMDKNTFYPICEKADGFCVLCYDNLFNFNDTYFFEYNAGKAKEFATKKKKGHKVDITT